MESVLMVKYKYKYKYYFAETVSVGVSFFWVTMTGGAADPEEA